MVEVLKAATLGLLQGLTEFIPISSSGHLVLIPDLLGWESPTVMFDVTLHLGTLIALIIYFKKELGELIISAFYMIKKKKVETAAEKEVLKLVAGTIPAVLIGLLFKDALEAFFERPLDTSFFLVVTGLLLFAGEHYAGKTAAYFKKVKELSYIDAAIIGTAQALAILPGISRSGATMTGGIFRGLTRVESARFSFLLSVPAIGGAFLLKLADSGLKTGDTAVVLSTGLITAFVSGYFAVSFLMKYLQSRKLSLFAWYCVTAGVIFGGLQLIR